MARKSYPSHPNVEHVRWEQRICFGIKWFKSEEDAMKYHDYICLIGRTYNGGFFDGMACGRSKGFDIKDQEGNITEFAVTC